ncbi:MAG: SusF/SusE family outer membrane protein [Aequorivita sp.]|nr:SusF/SusE family outer membrane protein [Aequorivita sp.]
MKNIRNKIKALAILVLPLILFTVSSCDDDLVDHSFDQDNELSLSVSQQDILLEEIFFNSTVSLNWSSGTNQNTGSAIKYTLQMDLASGDFSAPIATFLSDVQNTYSYDITYGNLNQILLDYGSNTNETYDLKARVVADVLDTSVQDQIALADFSVTTFKPVTEHLYIVGDATPNGWNIGSATELEASNNTRGVFVYEGPLSLGNFKFAVNQDGCWCQDFYTKDPTDDSKMVYNEGGSGDDLQWTIDAELGPDEAYKVTADLLHLTIQIEIVETASNTPPFPNLWIVGDASESGWNIDSPEVFVQSSADPFIFSYEGQLNPGNFKIFAGPLGDWCGEWYRPFNDNETLTNGSVDQNSGCDLDNKWIVTDATKGRYKIILNTQNNTIQFKPISLYLIGDGGPNGWNIANPTAMQYVNGEYVFTGPLGADNPTGEFKISKFVGNWCDGDWINAATANQSINNTSFIYTVGCDGPDNKWKLQSGQAGNYEIRVNLTTETMTITAQ